MLCARELEDHPLVGLLSPSHARDSWQLKQFVQIPEQNVLKVLMIYNHVSYIIIIISNRAALLAKLHPLP